MKKYYEFKGLPKQTYEDKVRLEKECIYIKSESIQPDNSMLNIIYAPDPISGNPCSDLFFQLSNDPSVKEYIARELQSYRIQMEKVDDKDLALDFTKTQFEATEKYFERLRNYVSNSNDS